MREELIRPKIDEGRICIDSVKSAVVHNTATINDLRVLHHMERYEFVGSVINNSFERSDVSVLDVGCGFGHGLFVLKETLRSHFRSHVIGVDIDINALSVANKLYDDIDFICSDATRLAIKPNVDVIIFFEALGNENIEDDKMLLTYFRNIISDDGIIFVSIPSYRSHPPKSYFARLYNQESFRDLMQECFGGIKIALYGQMHPANRDDILGLPVIAQEFYEEGDFMLSVIGG